MSRKPWIEPDRRKAASSAHASVNPPSLLESLEQVRSAIADLTQSRERVQEQMNSLALQQEKLKSQAAQARRAGREDLALEALARGEAAQQMFSELDTGLNKIKADEQQAIGIARQMQAIIDSPSGIPWQHSTAFAGHVMSSGPSLPPTGSAWRIDAETIMCALLPHVHGTWPTVPDAAWWAIQPPTGGITRVRAEVLGPGYLICLGSIQPLDEATRNERTLSGVLGQALGTAAVNYMESRKVAAPIAAFRHYGRAGEPVYFGFASHVYASEFPPEKLLYVRPGQWHSPCPQHLREPFLEMAAALRSFMMHLWEYVGGSKLGHLGTTRLTISEADFMASMADDVPSNVLPDVGRVAEYAGLIAFRRDSGTVRTGLTPAGAVWYLANQRLVGDELIGNAMPKQNVTVRAGDRSVVQVGSQDCSAHVGGDHYTSGTVGAQGPGSKAIVAFGWLPSGSSIEELQSQLKDLRMVLRERAREPQDDISVGAMGEAELAAADGDEKRLMLALKKAGRWALAAAQEVGLQVAAAALAKATGTGLFLPIWY